MGNSEDKVVAEKLELRNLVYRAQQGERDVFNEIYNLTNNRIYYLALKMVKNPDDALDIVQDSYIAGFSKIDTLKSPEAFLFWMYRITANNCKKFFIKSRDTISFDNENINLIDNISEDKEGFLPQASMENKETQKIIMDIVDKLPDAQRNCIILYYFSEMSVSEIAEIMECSEGTVKSRLNYGRKRIKEAVLNLEEKENIRLYGFFPFGTIAALFQTIPEDTFSSIQGAENIWDGIVANAGIGTATMGATTAAGSSRKISILATIKAKMMAGVIGITVVTTGIIMSTNSNTALNFTEAAFETAIRATIEKPTGKVYKKDLNNIWGMEMDNEGFRFIQNHDHSSNSTPMSFSEDIKREYSLEDIIYLKNLDYVSMGNIVVDSLTPFGEIGLKDLLLFNVEVSDWNSLGSLSDLNSLHILYSSNAPFDKLPSMLGLKELKQFLISPIHLGLDILPMDISSISDAQSLVVADINGLSIKDLSPLSKLKDLKALGLNGSIYDVSPLAGLDKLMVISIISSEQIQGQETFRQLPSLQVLQVSDSQEMSLSIDEWENRQMDIEGVAVDYNHFDRNIDQVYIEVMRKIYESISN